MRPADVIRAKRDGHALSADDLRAFVNAATAHARGEPSDWAVYQLSALLMAVYFRGLTPAETALLTRAMADSGRRYDLTDIPGPKIDKHSTGGVGDKTSLILAPLAAECGVVVPMMSGRGLGNTGGTLDKLEAIPGFRVGLSEAEFRAALKTVGVGLIGQSADIAPADKALYALRDVTATVENLSLITASILSKKLSEGITGLVLDVKFGRGAFMKELGPARELAESLVRVATANGLTCEALLTDMNSPLGRAVGNALEVIESVEVLKCQGDAELTELSVTLAARMVRMAGLAGTDRDAAALVRAKLASGAGLERFRRIVEFQGGDPAIVDDYSRLPAAPVVAVIEAERAGFVTDLDAELVAIAAMRMGAGRGKADDAVDPAVGVVCRATLGEAVEVGSPLFEVHARSADQLAGAERLLRTAVTYGQYPPAELPLVRGVVK